MRRRLFAAAIPLLVCVFSVMAACSGDSSHEKSNNPAPVLNSVSPTSATVGGAAFTLTANGSRFVTGSIVQLNGAARATTYVSNAQLTAAIPAADLASTGVAQVTVVNPTPGGGASSAITVTIQLPAYLLTDLGTLPGGRQSVGEAMNASGQVTGWAETSSWYSAFFTQNSSMIDLGAGRGLAINDSGQVTGWNSAHHAFVTQDGVMFDLGTLGGIFSESIKTAA